MSGSVHVNNPAVRQFYFTPYNPHLTRYDNSRNILICLEGQLLGKTVYTHTHTHRLDDVTTHSATTIPNVNRCAQGHFVDGG